MRKIVLVQMTLALLFLVVQAASAQEKCDPKETVNKCLSRLSEGPRAKAEKEAAAKESAKAEEETKTQAPSELWEQLTGKATGLNLSGLDLDSATEDFLPLLRIAFAAAGLGDAVDRSALNFDRKIGTFGADKSWELKLKGAVNEPAVYAPLKIAFMEPVREQRANDLKAKLRDFDDYSLTLDLNRSSESYGRTPNSYSQLAFQNLLQRVVESTKFEEAPDFALLEILEDLGKRGVTSPDTKTFEELRQLEQQGTIPTGSAQKVEQAVLGATRGAVLTVENLKKKAADLSIFKVADLLNNQPQIIGSGTFRLRKGAAGPDEITAKASYEHGFANLNRLRRKCGEPNSAEFVDCYLGFMKENQNNIEHNNRFSLTAEYNRIDAFRFSLPADQINLNLNSQDGLVLTLAYARFIDTTMLGDSNSRIDVSGKYESKDDRGVISLTYTNRLLKSMGGSLGISYANHDRFLPKSDRVLSAHFGLSFNSFTKTPPKKP